MPFSAGSFEWRFVDVAASRALLATDAFVWLNVFGAVNITVPDPADVAFQVGTQIALEQVGAGVFTLVAGGSVNIESRGGLLKSNGQFAVVSLVLQPSPAQFPIWTAFGDLA